MKMMMMMMMKKMMMMIFLSVTSMLTTGARGSRWRARPGAI